MKIVSLARAMLIATLSISQAPAADIAGRYQAPAPIAPAPYTWTGLYVGGNVGYSWATISSTATVFGVSGTGLQDLSGVLGGGQIGYNWQLASWVLGLEADIQRSGQQTSATASVGPLTITETEKFPWFGTLRGRLGFTPADRWLVYLTGGLPYGEGRASITATLAGLGSASATVTQDRIAWTLGGGVEAALWGNWSAKVEYLYIDSGRVTNNYQLLGIPLTANTRICDNIVRVGINYRFGWQGPAVANY
jgi:outer membrane immunogenic protein